MDLHFLLLFTATAEEIRQSCYQFNGHLYIMFSRDGIWILRLSTATRWLIRNFHHQTFFDMTWPYNIIKWHTITCLLGCQWKIFDKKSPQVHWCLPNIHVIIIPIGKKALEPATYPIFILLVQRQPVLVNLLSSFVNSFLFYLPSF